MTKEEVTSTGTLVAFQSNTEFTPKTIVALDVHHVMMNEDRRVAGRVVKVMARSLTIQESGTDLLITIPFYKIRRRWWAPVGFRP